MSEPPAVRRFRVVDPPEGWPAAVVDSDDYDALVLWAAADRKAAATFRATLVRIADQESGVWGEWAAEALAKHPELYPGAKP
jgi:hypothetical protein